MNKKHMDLTWVFKKLSPKRVKKKKRRQEQDVQELRRIFQRRYHHFKLLLTANNTSLEVMSEIEQALDGAKPFGMSYVRAQCTRVATSCYQVIHHLDRLAPNAYIELFNRFHDIQDRLQALLESPRREGIAPYVLPLKDITRDEADLAGTKATSLAELGNRLGFNTPPGFVVTAAAYHRFLEHSDLQTEIDRQLQAKEVEQASDLYELSSAIQQMIIRAPVPEEIANRISELMDELEGEKKGPVRLAVRSSAIGEDLPGATFAGQYRSELNVSREHLLQAYKEVVASKYGLAAMTYRWSRGIPDEAYSMSVFCLAMVESLCGGVIYTRNPVAPGDGSLLITSVYGLPKTVVDGTEDADRFLVTRSPGLEILERHIAEKARRLVCLPEEGLQLEDVQPELRLQSSLTDEQVLDLARKALKIEEAYGSPQDIEWTIDSEGRIVLLQCRPLQTGEDDGQDIVSEDRASEHEGLTLLGQGGQTASPGLASGPVFPVRKDMDALGFPEGAVLVTSQALPRWATLMNRATAVVTEKGNLAGHLANVAREFRVPALFGLPKAMEILKEGEVVSLDAGARKVYQGRFPSRGLERTTPQNLMRGSPVYNTLKEASRHIVPLTLLDTEAAEFRPANCKTLHDLTRFCHERSLQEMFRFGRDYSFPERASKQLKSGVPMQFWVLNLEDGFIETKAPGDRYISIDEITSPPMLALWEGMTAIAWEGPPPVNGRGFMSVLAEATLNPDLEPSLRSSMDMRNYFMISRHFCSLQSRFGFHFSTVEALVSDRMRENYISFRFKGGAANMFRRMRRAKLLAEILQDLGFQNDIRHDALSSRLEDHEQDIMLNRLKILGYLIIHTRQLDMVMGTENGIERYRQKLHADIQSLNQT